MYNFFVVPMEFLFIHFLYYKNLPKYFRATVLSLSVIYLVFWIAEYFFLKHFNWVWLSTSYNAGCITILILGIIYFLQLLKSEKIVVYKKQIFYWVNLGVILFYVGTFPYYAMLKTLYETEPQLFAVLMWWPPLLNYVMYGFFIKGFLCINIKGK